MTDHNLVQRMVGKASTPGGRVSNPEDITVLDGFAIQIACALIARGVDVPAAVAAAYPGASNLFYERTRYLHHIDPPRAKEPAQAELPFVAETEFSIADQLNHFDEAVKKQNGK